MKTELHVVPTFHHDIAYLHPEVWYRDRAFQLTLPPFQVLGLRFSESTPGV